MRGDRIFLILIILLTSVGILILTSASNIIAQKNFGDNFYYVKHQLFYGILLGFILGFLAYKLPVKYLSFFSIFIFLASILSLLLIFVPELGFSYGGARRWLKIGSFVFQPSELAKLGLVLYLSAFFAKVNSTKIKTISGGIIPFVVIVGLVVVPVILEPDLGTALVLLAAAILIYFIAGIRWSHIFALFLVLVVIVVGLIAFSPYKMQRIESFLSPEKDLLGANYQANQALIAIGSGGLFGVGFGQSQQKYFYLPEVIGDSIFAIYAEEFGFVGAIVLIVLFIIFLLKGFIISLNANDKFSKMAGTGIVGLLSAQFFLNIAAISSLLPLTGVTLPFISYGSSSLVVVLVGSAILLNISKSK